MIHLDIFRPSTGSMIKNVLVRYHRHSNWLEDAVQISDFPQPEDFCHFLNHWVDSNFPGFEIHSTAVT
jgi:hypothetical protein